LDFKKGKMAFLKNISRGEIYNILRIKQRLYYYVLGKALKIINSGVKLLVIEKLKIKPEGGERQISF
jgi:hypothetical protein